MSSASEATVDGPKGNWRTRLPSIPALIGIGIMVAIGVAERVILLRHSSLQPDADESMSGLMARNLLDGNFDVFLWGQPYGGAAEVIPVAGSIAVFGQNLFAMRAFGIALGVIAPFLLWRVATRHMSQTAAVVAALTLWVWPVAFISWSLREFLYYQPVVTLGLLGVLCAQRCAEKPERWKEPAVVGLTMGIGWWMSPFVAYLGLFVVLTLVLVKPAQLKRWLLRRAWVTVAAFVVGSLPWLYSNLANDFLSLKRPEGSTGGSYLSHLEYLSHPGLSIALGLKGWYSKAWPFDSKVLGVVLLGVFALLAAFVAVRAFIRWGRKQERFPVDIVCLMAWPFLYATSPMTGSDELWVPRYFFFLWPFMALMVGRLVVHRKAAPVVLAAVVAMAGLQLSDQVKRVNDWPYTGALRAQAEANGVTRMFTSYWVAYKVTYETDAKLIATPAYPPTARYKPIDEIVRSADKPAWAFRAGDQREQRFLDATRKMGLNLQPIPAGAYNLYLLDRKLLPEDLPTDVHLDPVEGV